MPLRGPAEFAAASPDENMIDDFEDGEVPALPKVGGRNGAWITHTPAAAARSDGPRRDINQVRRERHALRAPHRHGVTPYGASWNASMLAPFASATPSTPAITAAFRSGSRRATKPCPPLEMPIGLMTTDTVRPRHVCNPCGDYYRVSRGHPADPLLDAVGGQVQRPDARAGWAHPRFRLNKDRLVSLMIWPAEQLRHLDRRRPLRA